MKNLLKSLMIMAIGINSTHSAEIVYPLTKQNKAGFELTGSAKELGLTPFKPGVYSDGTFTYKHNRVEGTFSRIANIKIGRMEISMENGRNKMSIFTKDRVIVLNPIPCIVNGIYEFNHDRLRGLRLTELLQTKASSNIKRIEIWLKELSKEHLVGKPDIIFSKTFKKGKSLSPNYETEADKNDSPLYCLLRARCSEYLSIPKDEFSKLQYRNLVIEGNDEKGWWFGYYKKNK